MTLKGLIFTLTIAGVINHSVYAEDLDGPATTFSSPINFCNVKAKKAIGDLDKLALAKVAEIKKIKTEINDLSAKKNLIGGFLKIRDEYKSAYDAIANQQKQHDQNLSDNVDNFKKLLNTSLTMSAVNLVAKAEKTALHRTNLNAQTISELCLNAANSKSNLCEYVNNKFWVTHSEEIQTLNKTLSNVYKALDNSESPEAIKTELETIYNTIPTPIAPDKILGDLQGLSPNFVKMLGGNADKNLIMNCISNSDDNESCKKLMDNPSARESAKTIITSEMEGAQKEFSNRKFNDFFNALDISAPQSKGNLSDLVNKKANEASDYFEKDLKNKNGKLKDLGFEKADLEKFKNVCIQKEDSLKMDECEKYAKKMVAYFENENADNEKSLKDALERLDQAVNENGTIETIEKMKQYVAEKYVRTCKGAKEKDVISEVSCPCLNENELGTNLPGNASQLGQLNLRLSSVIGKLKTQSPVSDQRGELGPFSKQELEVYKNYCRNTSAVNGEIAASICNDVYNESNKIANQKESKEWDDFNKKYWVQYSPTKKVGYDLYEKKSNSRLFAEGLSQSVSNLYPIWFSNFQLQGQIDLMTNQALYQKQLIYMNNPTSPWMAFPYFQGNYFPTTTTTPAMPGFNFSN